MVSYQACVDSGGFDETDHTIDALYGLQRRLIQTANIYDIGYINLGGAGAEVTLRALAEGRMVYTPIEYAGRRSCS